MCGEGIEMRTRKRFPARYDGPNCVGPATEERECKLDPCSGDFKENIMLQVKECCGTEAALSVTLCL